jgi:hypothetical protein
MTNSIRKILSCFGIPIVLLAANLSLKAQVLKGTVLDSNTLEPIPYVNVKVPGTLTGTLTNMEGAFQLDISEIEPLPDSVQFSLLSYKRLVLPTTDLMDSSVIKLPANAFTLAEVVVSPRPAEDYIREAIERIPQNCIDTTYNTKVYFREVIKLNGVYLNYTEAIMNAYNLPITGKPGDSTRLQIIAMRHVSEMEKGIETVQFKKNKKKQAEIDTAIIDLVQSMVNENGPYMLLDSSLERRWYSQDMEKMLKNYHFQFRNITPYEDRKLLNITYSDKKKEEKGWEKGHVYLEENSLAIESYGYKFDKVPAVIKAALLLFGYGMDELKVKIKSTSRPTEYGYLNDLVVLRADIGVEKKKIFGDNVPFEFEIEAVMIVLDDQIPATNECRDGIVLKRKKALHKQAEPNPNHPVWQHYRKVILPEGGKF